MAKQDKPKETNKVVPRRVNEIPEGYEFKRNDEFGHPVYGKKTEKPGWEEPTPATPTPTPTTPKVNNGEPVKKRVQPKFRSKPKEENYDEVTMWKDEPKEQTPPPVNSPSYGSVDIHRQIDPAASTKYYTAYKYPDASGNYSNKATTRYFEANPIKGQDAREINPDLLKSYDAKGNFVPSIVPDSYLNTGPNVGGVVRVMTPSMDNVTKMEKGQVNNFTLPGTQFTKNPGGGGTGVVKGARGVINNVTGNTDSFIPKKYDVSGVEIPQENTGMQDINAPKLPSREVGKMYTMPKFKKGGRVKGYADGTPEGGVSGEYDPNKPISGQGIIQTYGTPFVPTGNATNAQGQKSSQVDPTDPYGKNKNKGKVKSEDLFSKQNISGALAAGTSLSTALAANQQQKLEGAQKDKATANAINTSLDTVASMVPVYGQIYGATQLATGLVTNALPKDANGNYKTKESEATANFMNVLSPHKAIVNDLSKGDTTRAIGDTLTAGIYGGVSDLITYEDRQKQAEAEKQKKLDEYRKINTQAKIKQSLHNRDIGEFGAPTQDVYDINSAQFDDAGNFQSINPTGYKGGGVVGKVKQMYAKGGDVKPTITNDKVMEIAMSGKGYDVLNKYDKQRVDAMKQHMSDNGNKEMPMFPNMVQGKADGGPVDGEDEGSVIKNKLSRNTLTKDEKSNQDKTRVSNLPVKTLQELQAQANIEKAAKQQYKQQPVISQGRKLTPEEQAYSDKVQARIANPSNDVGITAANMASALTRFRYLNPEEIAATTNNPANTIDLASNMMAEGLTNEIVGPAFGKAVKNTYRINPWAEHLKNPNSSYRVAGLDAAKDFKKTGSLRSATPNVPEGASLKMRAMYRPTSFPSFQKGYADLRYLPDEGGVIFKTDLPTFKRGELNPVTGSPIKGRHYAHRVIDPKTGATLTNIPGADVKMYGSEPHWLKGYQEIQGKADGGKVSKFEIENNKKWVSDYSDALMKSGMQHDMLNDSKIGLNKYDIVSKYQGSLAADNVKYSNEQVNKLKKGLDFYESKTKGYNNGGKIEGKGTAKSDSIMAKVEEGSFVVPAENADMAKGIRKLYLKAPVKKANLNQKEGEEVKLSNGEHLFTPQENEYLESIGISLEDLAPNAEHEEDGKKNGGLTSAKAKTILHDKHVNGKPLTDKQRKFFGAIASGQSIKGYAAGGDVLGEDEVDPAKELARIKKEKEDLDKAKEAKGKYEEAVRSKREAEFKGKVESYDRKADRKNKITSWEKKRNDSKANLDALNKSYEAASKEFKARNTPTAEQKAKGVKEGSDTNEQRKYKEDLLKKIQAAKSEFENADRTFNYVKDDNNYDASGNTKTAPKDAVVAKNVSTTPVETTQNAKTYNELITPPSGFKGSSSDWKNSVDAKIKSGEVVPKDATTATTGTSTKPTGLKAPSVINKKALASMNEPLPMKKAPLASDAVPSDVTLTANSELPNMGGIKSVDNSAPVYNKKRGSGILNALGNIDPTMGVGPMQTAMGINMLQGSVRPIDKAVLDATYNANVNRAQEQSGYGYTPEQMAMLQQENQASLNDARFSARNFAGGNAGTAFNQERQAINQGWANKLGLTAADQELRMQKQKYADAQVANRADTLSANRRQAYLDALGAFNQKQAAGSQLIGAGLQNVIGTYRYNQELNNEDKQEKQRNAFASEIGKTDV